jgi:DNA polymerase II large subunit
MYLLGEFLAIGTQLKIERPGKAGVVTSCDQIEGPIVLLKNQKLMQINNVDQAMELRDQIDVLVDLGEILIPFGEFVENNHDLVPGAFDTNWWRADLENALKNKNLEKYRSFLTKQPTAEEAFEVSKELKIPLHPGYNLFWHDVNIKELTKLQEFISENGTLNDNKLHLPNDPEIKSILIDLCALHTYDKTKDQIILDQYSLPLVRCLGLNENDGLSKSKEISKIGKNNVLKVVSELAGIKINRRGPTRIGASMGRPEKAKERMMKPPVHILFPLGNAGGTQRLVKTAAENSKISIEAGTRYCQSCGARTIFTTCNCGGHTIIPPKKAKPNGYINPNEFKQELALRDVLSNAQKNLNEPQLPDMKGVIGLISEHKTPEPLEKGILRAKHSVYVFKDGTIRFDMTDVPLTHFKPLEIGTSIEKLHELGYTHDHNGEPLSDNSQIVELKPQDIIPSKNAGTYLLRVSKFIDDLLTKYYRMDSYYNANAPSDLVGQIVLGLSPHTSGAVLGRIVGYTQSRVGYAHPFYHAAKRRNCDGDEDCIMLALDGLINFSKSYLPGSRGGFMDAPLVLMTYINPNEIDKEAQNVDISSSYPLDFYLAAERFAKPKEVESIVETVSNRIGTIGQFENFSFMFDTSSLQSRYEQLMKEWLLQK